MLAIEAMVLWPTTIYIFTQRSCKVIPAFVTVQMIFINIFLILHIAYISMIYEQYETESSKVPYQKPYQNLIATLADAFFFTHDWIFIEQMLSASLTMPIALNWIRNYCEIEAAEKRVKSILSVVNVAFYVLLILWFLVSAVTGKFLWRMSVNLLSLFTTVIYVVSLLRIKRIISQINNRQQFKPNIFLMNLNLYTFALEVVTFGAIFVLAIMLPYYQNSSDINS